MSNGIYNGVQQTKNGSSVPVFTNGRAFFSTYNPERDAENFILAHQETFSGAGCILIGGIGNGIHLHLLLKKYPDTRIIAFEADESSLAFSRTLLSNGLIEASTAPKSRFILTSADKLKQLLPATYIPALHGNFAFAAVRSWHDFLGDKASLFLSCIQETIADISADYSVQAQFGKIWHKNILTNLLLYDSMNAEQHFSPSGFTPHAKKAAITGAGPSLEQSIQKLQKHRLEYCIFATDTSFSTLKNAGITPDFAVTVDSQHISEQHFIGHNLSGTVLASDLTGNSSIIAHAISQNIPVLLFHNSHPLSELADNWIKDIKSTESPFPFIDSGAGTVLHAATDLARKLGFSKLEFFGADFSYIDGKPYTKGTYLEKMYYKDENRIANAETSYSRLMYRTPLIPVNDNSVTTEVLSRYKKALELFLDKAESFPLNNQPDLHRKNEKSILMNDFIPWYKEKLHKNDEKVFFSLLPLAAWYKKNFTDADTECVYAFAEQLTANVGRIQCQPQKK